MVLESTMICVDDSDFMRNGDFVPTRLAAMQDAVSIVCHSKTRSNPENNVGLLTMASSEVLTTLTTDVNKLISKLLALQPQGELKLLSGLRVAHLALKHRQGKNHKMRIIVFVGSPMDAVDQAELVRLAKRLKKEKVNVDVVSFGEEKGNAASLNAFIETLNGKDGTGSHLLTVAGSPSLTDALVQSPILQTEDGGPAPGIGAGGYDFGMDGDDPELALALRVSMEEQRARQEAESRGNNPESGTEGASNEERMLEQALQMSIDNPAGAPRSSSGGAPDFSSMTEEEQIAYAMQMSMQDAATEVAKPTAVKKEASSEEAMDVDEIPTQVVSTPDEGLADADYLQQVLEGLPSSNSPKKEADPPAPAAAASKKPGDPKSGGSGSKKK
ncbi:26S proteasome non-ATPase regulatory subunit 4 [Folsomia candida]|nr:26S proteasome non-ATPase regulatory subunit 4 [Folsomia candida]